MRPTLLGLAALASLLVLDGTGRAAVPEPLQTFAHGEQVGFLAFSPDGTLLASGGGGGSAKVCIWHLGEGEPAGELDAHRAGITGMVFTPDGKHLVTSAWDCQVIVWDVNAAQELRRFEGHDEAVSGLALSADGKLLATGSLDCQVRVFDFATGKELRRITVKKRDPREEVVSVAFSPDGTHVAVLQGARPVRFWEVATGKEVTGLRDDGPASEEERRRSGDRYLKELTQYSRYRGTYALGAGDYQRSRLAGQGVRLSQFGGYPLRAFDHFSPDGQTIAYVVGQHLMLLETASGRDRYEWRSLEPVTAVAFAADGRHLAWAEGKGQVHTGSLAQLAGASDPPEKPDARQRQEYWADLGADAPRAYRTSWLLSAAAGAAVPLLRDKLLGQGKVDPKRLEQLLANLDSSKFQVRQKATEQLETLGVPALAAVRTALAGKPSLEFTRRAERLVDVLEENIRADVIRNVRAVEVLARIGTADARQTLEQIARDPLPAGSAAQEAAAQGLRRLQAAGQRDKP
jgi:hypothetical protein